MYPGIWLLLRQRPLARVHAFILLLTWIPLSFYIIWKAQNKADNANNPASQVKLFRVHQNSQIAPMPAMINRKGSLPFCHQEISRVGTSPNSVEKTLS